MTKSTRHMTSSINVVDLKANNFGRKIYPPSVTVVAFIRPGAESSQTLPPPPENKGKPGLDMVKCALLGQGKKL